MVKVTAEKGLTWTTQEKSTDNDIAMNKIWDKGVLCQIQSSVWSMEVRLVSSDLNMNSAEIPPFVKLGTKRLLPQTVRDEFNKHIWNAKSSAKKYGIPYFISNSFFIPFGNMDKLTERINTERTAFYERLENFLERYAPLRESYLEENDSYKHILEEHYPTPEVIRTKFKFNVVYYAASISDVSLGDIGSAEEVYLEWVVSAANTIRKEARDVAESIGKSIEDGTNNGKTMRKVQTLLDRVQKMDLLPDDALLKATRTLASDPTKGTVQDLKKIAKDVNPLYVRRVLLD